MPWSSHLVGTGSNVLHELRLHVNLHSVLNILVCNTNIYLCVCSLYIFTHICIFKYRLSLCIFMQLIWHHCFEIGKLENSFNKPSIYFIFPSPFVAPYRTHVITSYWNSQKNLKSLGKILNLFFLLIMWIKNLPDGNCKE